MMLSRLAAILLTLLLPGAGLAAEQSFTPLASGRIVFETPSGNVGCWFTPKGGADDYRPKDGGPELACDRVEPEFLRLFLRAKGKAQRYENSGDTTCCDGTNVLRYGNAWSKSGYACRSTREGLTCTRGKNGFFISKSKTSAF